MIEQRETSQEPSGQPQGEKVSPKILLIAMVRRPRHQNL